jgi:hypothetical protein
LADQDDGLEIFIYGEDLGEPEVIRREDSVQSGFIVDQIPLSASAVFIGMLLGVILIQKNPEKPITIT